MSRDIPKAYSRKQWFWAVNLSAALGAIGFLVPSALQQPISALVAFPYALIVALVVAWVFVAPLMALAMRKPRSWTDAVRWGGGTAAAIAIAGFVIAHIGRLRAQSDPTFHSRLGGGDYVREIDGVLTPYGWLIVVQNNVLFVMLGIAIALVLRAVFGGGATVQ